MIWAKRILLVCMALSFTSFSAVAAAPAHTHEIDETHGSMLHVVSAHHDHHDQDFDGGSALLDIADRTAGDPDKDMEQQPAQPHGPSLHFHEIVHFAAVDLRVSLGSKIDRPLDHWAEGGAPSVTGDWLPLRRPPRT